MLKFLAGEWVDSGDRMEVRSPYDGELVGTVPRSNLADVEAAMVAATEGARVMAERPAYARSETIRRAADLLSDKREELAQCITREAGKTIHEARTEVGRAVETLRLSAEEGKRLFGESLPMDSDPAGNGTLGFTLRVPVGIVVAITPFNFPLNLVCHKVGPALAAGNAVIIKPAEETPLSALKLVEALLDAGLPPLAVQCLPGEGEVVGAALVADPRVRKVSFTGSRSVGQAIMRLAGVKRTTLELGSNSPLIVLPDADVEHAAKVTVAHGYANAGQVCISAQRLLVAREVYHDFVELVSEEVKQIQVGDPLSEQTRMGPMIRAGDAARVNRWIREAQAAGARVVAGGSVSGTHHEATVVADVTGDMRIAREELFGPAVAAFSVESVGEALSLANATDFGLAAGVFTRDLGAAKEVIRRLDAGSIMINAGPQWRADFMPYGGLKGSGIGKEGPRYAVAEMTELKTVVLH